MVDGWRERGGGGGRARDTGRERERETWVGSWSSVTPRPLRSALRLTSEITVSSQPENSFYHHVFGAFTERSAPVHVPLFSFSHSVPRRAS